LILLLERRPLIPELRLFEYIARKPAPLEMPSDWLIEVLTLDVTVETKVVSLKTACIFFWLPVTAALSLAVSTESLPLSSTVMPMSANAEAFAEASEARLFALWLLMAFELPESESTALLNADTKVVTAFFI